MSSPHLTPHLPLQSFRSIIIQNQIATQNSFSMPNRIPLIILLILPYIQILKYPFDGYYSTFWLKNYSIELSQSTEHKIFAYINIAEYTKAVSPILSIAIVATYLLLYILMLTTTRLRLKPIKITFRIAKMLLSSFLYIFIICQLCKCIRNTELNTYPIWIKAVAMLCLVLFSGLIILQNFLDFDFMLSDQKVALLKQSNWTPVFLLLYILINQITLALLPSSSANAQYPSNKQQAIPHLIIMNIFFALIVFAFIFKKQWHHSQQSSSLSNPLDSEQPVSPTLNAYKLQFAGIAINVIAIIMIDIMILLQQQQFSMDISLWLMFSIITTISIYHYQQFTITKQLQNINKWNNSQTMMQYTNKLLILLQNKNSYYYQILILGYIEIHRQKCDSTSCPIHQANNQNIPEYQIEELIKKIFGEGCRLSPVSQQLLVQYAIFLYYCNNREKALKILLSVKEEQLSLEKMYKYVKLKDRVYSQILEQPNQKFLNLLSEMQVKQYQKSIVKKFEEAALANLQFWSVLNEDYPDFNKLYQIGIYRVQKVGEKVHQLYDKICSIANSQRITHLFINYMKDIENDEFMYQQILNSLEQQKKLKQKVVIQDWANDSRAIMIISMQQENKGIIIDLNTTCATMLGYQKYQLISRDINHLFPGKLSNQMNRFLKLDYSTIKYHSNKNIQSYLDEQQQTSFHNDDIFYLQYSNGYCLTIKRTVNNYNSIQTGMSLILTLQQQFTLNNCYLIFSYPEFYQHQQKLKTNLFHKKLKISSSTSKNSKSNSNSNQIKINPDQIQEKLIGISSSCIQMLGIEQQEVQQNKRYSDIFTLPLSHINNEKVPMKITNILLEINNKKSIQTNTLQNKHNNYNSTNHKNKNKTKSERIVSDKLNQQYYTIIKQMSKQFIIIKLNIVNNTNKVYIDNQEQSEEKSFISNNNKVKFEEKKKKYQSIQPSNSHNGIRSNRQLQFMDQKPTFQFQVCDCFNTFTYYGDLSGKQPLLPLQTLFSLTVEKRDTIQDQKTTNYAEGITTLRLYEDYVKVIEFQDEDSEQQSKDKADNSTTDAQFERLSKKDQQRIFQSHKTFCQFIEKHQLKTYIRGWALFCYILTIGSFISIYFIFNSDLGKTVDNYEKIINKNQMIGQIAISRFLIIQVDLAVKMNKIEEMQKLLLRTMGQVEIDTHQVFRQYPEHFNIQVLINPGNPPEKKTFLSDQFLLSFTSHFNQLYNSLKSDSNPKKFNNNTQSLDSYSLWYVLENGKTTKELMVKNSQEYMQQKINEAQYILNKNIIMLLCGIFMQCILGCIFIWLLYKINQQKVKLLEIFLQSNQKIIQNFSAKTQSFLMTLHAEQTTDNTDIFDDLEKKKKSYNSNVFGRTKRFKTTQLNKIPYLLIVLTCMISSIYYINTYVYNSENFQFIKDTMQYAYKTSQCNNIVFSGISNIDQSLLSVYDNEQQSSLTNGKLKQTISQFNRQFLTYEKQFLAWHYRSFGQYQQFNNYFTKLYLYNICDGQVPIYQACQNQLSIYGASTIITDLTISNELLSLQLQEQKIFKEPNEKYQYTVNLQIVKHFHQKITEKSIQYWKQLQGIFGNNSVNVLIAWVFACTFVIICMEVYLSKVVLKDIRNLRGALKFLPVSFAIESPKVTQYISLILQQNSF